jgi:hypothetical protein
MFDNIRLWASTCNADYAYDNGLLADLNRDCTVDINDLDLFANDWLKLAETRTFTVTQPAAPVLWYKFNETGTVTTAADSSGNIYVGTIVNPSSLTWKSGEGRLADTNGCLYLPPGANSSVRIDVASLGFMGDDAHSVANLGGGITFATWINADLTADFSNWNHTFIGIDGADNNDMSTCLPHHYDSTPGDWSGYGAWAAWFKGEPNNGFGLGPGMPIINYGGRWNHWVLVKAPDALRVYCNGQMIKQELVTDANNGDPNIDGPLFSLPVTTFTIGTPASGWGNNWSGRIDDFQVYDYALSDAEVAYVATDGTGILVIPINLAANMVAPGTPAEQVVNFNDLSEMCTEWRTQILWP